MAKFLNTSGITYHLEELIKGARERLVIISPFLKLNDRIKEFLEDKNRMKIDIRVIYGKNELQPDEIQWLNSLQFIRTSFCKNLHAKCYLNEDQCIITSLNLYEFSQINNNEMGVLISRGEDAQLYRDAYEEAQRIIRISDEVRISLETVAKEVDTVGDGEDTPGKITSSRLAKKLKYKNNGEFLQKLVAIGYLEADGDKHHLTEKGKQAGGEAKFSKKFGAYFIWPDQMAL